MFGDQEGDFESWHQGLNVDPYWLPVKWLKVLVYVSKAKKYHLCLLESSVKISCDILLPVQVTRLKELFVKSRFTETCLMPDTASLEKIILVPSLSIFSAM